MPCPFVESMLIHLKRHGVMREYPPLYSTTTLGISFIFFNLSHFETKMSHRLFRQWLLQPLQDASEIQYRTNLVEFYSENMAIRQIFSNFFRKMPDIDKLLIKLFKVTNNQRTTSKLEDCYKLYRIVCELETLVTYLNNISVSSDFQGTLSGNENQSESKNLSFLKRMFGQIYNHFKPYKEFIINSLDIGSIENRREYLLNPGS
jgi:DNA mismatch repair ATPase MutS